MGWLSWMLIYFAGMIALWIWAYAHNSRKQRQSLAARIHTGVLNFDPIGGGAGAIATADFVEVIAVSTVTDTGGYEIVTRQGARIQIPSWPDAFSAKGDSQAVAPLCRIRDRRRLCCR